MKYVATAQHDGDIDMFGEGDTPIAAFSDFLNSHTTKPDTDSDFSDYCSAEGIEPNSPVSVVVYEQITRDMAEERELIDDFLDGWAWMLGDPVTDEVFVLATT